MKAPCVTIADTQTTGDDGQIGYPMTIHADEPLPDQLAQTNLRVTITAASTDTDALVVPLAAISSSADGSTNVSVLGPDEEPTVVPVVAGISADGFVAIEPGDASSLAEGDSVVVGR